MGRDEQTGELMKIFAMSIKTAIRDRNSHSRIDIGCLKTNGIKLQSGATSLFDVQRWTFDVRVCSILDPEKKFSH
jgi:hypothetical protein